MIEQVREHLRILSIFHYVVGGIGFVVSLFPVIHLIIGIAFLVMPEETFEPPRVRASFPEAVDEAAPPVEAEEPPSGPTHATHPPAARTVESSSVEVFPARIFGLMFTIIPLIIILSGFALSTAIVIAGRRLSQFRSHTYCLVMAGVECLLMPFGTVLGVFTIIVLTKPEARELFGLPPLTAGATPAGPGDAPS